MIVNACSEAKLIEQKNNITSFYTQFNDDYECYSISEVQDNVD